MRKTLILLVLALLLVSIGVSATISDEISSSVAGFGGKVWDVLKGIYNFFSSGMTGFVAYTGKTNVTTNYTHSEDPLTSDMVGYWKLNGNANDETSNHNDGTVYGATPTTDCVFGTGNCAYSFDGANNHITVADNSALDLSTNFAIEFWVKTSSGVQSGIIDRTDENGTQNFWGYGVWMNAGGHVYFYDDVGGWQTSAGTINNGSWHHVAVTLAGGSGCVYIDGRCDTAINGSANSNSLPLLIGSGRDASNNPLYFLNGIIDQVIIYNRSLTAQEINESYTREIATVTTNKTTNLTIWDTTDNSPAIVNQNVYVYANYTGNGHPIDDSVGSCTFSLTSAAMHYNSVSKLYFYNGSSHVPLHINYTINCSSADYNALTLSDQLSIVSSRINITNVLPYAKTKNSVKINWTTNIPGNSTIKYGITKALASHVSSASKVTKHSISLSGLSNATRYYYNVTSYNSSVNYAVSGPYNFTTKINDVAPIISGVVSHVIDSESARMTWNNSEPANSRISYSKNSVNFTLNQSDTSYRSNGSITISGLENYTTYYYKIKACDVDGDCSTSSIYNFRTLQTSQAPSAVHVPGTGEGLQLPQITSFTLTETPHQSTLTPGGRFIFDIDGNRHEMKMLNVLVDRVTVLFSSEQLNLTFNKGETKKVDLDGDGVNDIEVTINDIILTKIIFTINTIKEAAAPQGETVPEKTNEEEKNVTKEMPTELAGTGKGSSIIEKLKLASLIFAALIIAAVIGIGGYYTYQKTATVDVREAATPEEMEKINQLPKPQLEVLIDDVKSMLRAKATEDDVRARLEGARLSKSVIDALLYEIKTGFSRLDKLVLYLKLQKVRGKSVDKIRGRLARVEWSEEILKLLE